MQFWSALEAYIERGESAVVYLVAHSTRHSPGTPGARMFVTSSGAQDGTIGGGIMEADLKRDASLSLARREHRMPKVQQLVHRAKGQGVPSGLICAGEQTNVVWHVDPSMLDDIATLADFERTGHPGKLRLTESGHEISPTHVDHRVSPVRFVEGEQWSYEELIFEWRRVSIVGGGHCGLALSQVLTTLGYHVTVFDVRQDCPTIRQNYFANQIEIVEDYAEVGGRIAYRPFQHVAVMTADFPSDVRALVGISKIAGIPYVGLMGSPAKLHKIFEVLREQGIPQDFIDSLRAPIGLPMKSNKPEEIAISIAAQLLQLRDELFAFSRWPDPA